MIIIIFINENQLVYILKTKYSKTVSCIIISAGGNLSNSLNRMIQGKMIQGKELI